MASISGTVTIAGDPDDWIAVAWDADTHAYAGVATVAGGAYTISGLTAGKAYVVGCRPKTGGVWAANRETSVNDLTLASNTSSIPYVYKATNVTVGDPYLSSVSLLMHMDGTDNGTTFSDYAGRSVTRVGAVTKTGNKQFGSASAYFDGVNDYITVADHDSLDFGTGDFTIEFWVYANKASQLASYPRLITKGTGGINKSWHCVYFASTGQIYFEIYTPSTAGTLVGALTDNTWSHVAICRSGTTIKCFLNGVEGGNTTNSTELTNASDIIMGVEPGLVNDFLGYIDEIRITKGVSRYSAAFTPPSAPFPEISGSLTGSTEPAWPTTPGNTVLDNDITWTNMGQMVRPLMQGPLIAA